MKTGGRKRRKEMDTLRKALEKYCEENRIMCVLRVTRKDKVVLEFSYGYADFERKIDYCENSMFSLYSITKPFCAIGLLRLKDLGLVDIDHHPGEYLPEMKKAHPKLTIRHMLHHISGLPDFAQTKEFAEKKKYGPRELSRLHLSEILEYPHLFEPGTDAKYENINFLPLALIIETVTGASYEEYMKKEVFAPLGAKTIQVDREGLFIENRVQGYELSEGELVPVDRTLSWMFGAGDLVGTVDDVYCLNRAIKQRLLLAPETWDEVLTPSPLNNMGLGCNVREWHGKRRVTHNGGSRGFRSLHVQLTEDDFDIIILSNSGFGDARNDISEMIYTAYYGEPEDKKAVFEMDKGYI